MVYTIFFAGALRAQKLFFRRVEKVTQNDEKVSKNIEKRRNSTSCVDFAKKIIHLAREARRNFFGQTLILVENLHLEGTSKSLRSPENFLKIVRTTMEIRKSLRN